MDVLHLNVTVNREDFHKGAYDVARHVKPGWKWEDVQFRVFTGGLTNKLIGVYHKADPDDIVLVRIYGESSELFVNRKRELKMLKFLHPRGFAAKLYLTFENGMAFEYLPGIPLNNALCQSVKVYPLVAQMTARLHKIKYDEYNPPAKLELWKMLDEFMDLIPEKFSVTEKDLRFRQCCPNGKIELKIELDRLKRILPTLGNPVVFCHNDIIPPNVIYNEKENTTKLIDFEIAGLNYQAYDLATHFTAYADEGGFENPQYPSKEFQLDWIREYLKEYDECVSPNEDSVQQLYRHVCQFWSAANFVALMWSAFQAEVSVIDFDFMKFSTDKFKEYKKSLHYLDENSSEDSGNIEELGST